MDNDTAKKLISLAENAMARAYAPYSGYFVGAALLCKNGRIYTGCNIENAAFSPTVCAERTAIFKAVSEGEREFEGIAVVGGKNGVISGFFPPCGVCRQVLSEFCGRDEFEVILGGVDNRYEIMKLGELLPFGFNGGEHLNK